MINGRSCAWDFTMADVSHSLIGADFLRSFGFLVDVKNKRLVDSSSLQMSKIHPGKGKPLAINSIASATDTWGKILAKFPRLTSPEFKSSPPHAVQHFICTKGPPPVAKPRRIAPHNFVKARQAFMEMLRLGIVRRSSSPFRSALVLVTKPDRSLRICGDYTALNSMTKPDSYPLPHLHDFARNLAGCHFFSKLDLIKGYHQIEMAKEDIHKTAVATPFGAFEYLRMPYG